MYFFSRPFEEFFTHKFCQFPIKSYVVGTHQKLMLVLIRISWIIIAEILKYVP